jgi:hypothetical protein
MNTIARALILSASVALASVAGARGLLQTPTSGGVIRVAVRTGGTLEPIAGARVVLSPIGAPSAQNSASAGQTISTGADGMAVFEKLVPGSYRIQVDSDGYIATPLNSSVGSPVPTASATALAGTQPVDVSVLLSSAGSISGRVFDAYGVPLANARVLVGNIGYREGRRTYMQQGSAQPDGFGNYVFSALGSGEYYIRLEPSALRGGGAYYPGVVDSDRAIRIPVQAGQQVVGIDFNMANSPTFKVSGTVLNLPARTLANGQPDNTVPNLSFASADPHNADSQAAPLLINGRRGSSGEFEIALPPGLWDVFPVINMRIPTPVPGANAPAPLPAPALGAAIYATGRVRVFVSDRDVENVTVSIAASDINGHIVFEGGTPGATSNPMRVGLLPLDNTPSPLVSHVRTAQSPDSTGAFSFASVPPGRYSLQLSPIPSSFYVADLRVGSKSVFDNGAIVVGNEPVGPIEVTLRSDGGTVQVAAETPPASGSLPRFVLVPAAPRRQNVLLYKNVAMSRSTSSTSLTVSNVAPGDYKVFAFEALPSGGAEQNAEFMAKYENLGVPIHVNANETLSVRVSWISAEK